MRVRLVGVVALLALAGCIELPEEYRIEDLRILNVRADPPEIRIFRDAPIRGPTDAVLATPLDDRDVRMQVLAAHPDLDATFEYSWIRCKDEPDEPGQPTGGFRRVPCGAEQKVRLGAGSSMLTFSPVKLLVEDIVAMNADPVAAIGSLAEDPRDLFSGLLLNVNAHVEEAQANVPVDTRELDARKRIVLYDPAVVALVLREARSGGFGMIPTMIQGVQLPSLCTETSDAQLATIIAFLEDRIPNRAPDFVGLEVLRSTMTGTTPFMPPVELAPGESMRIAGIARPGDVETYRVLDDNCEIIELNETLSWSWFVTDGTLTTHITTRSADVTDRRAQRTTYSAPTSFDGAERRVRIFGVLRDGRGGSDSASFDLVVRR